MQEYSKQRRRHSAEFKAEVLQACEQPGASTAGVALAFGLNANLVRQWRRGRGLVRAGLASPPQAAPATPRFVPVNVEDSSAPVREPALQPGEAGTIELQLRRGALAVSVRWPVGQAADCARLLCELLR
jgi:transposase